MLSVAVQKDVGEYKEKIILGLSLKSLIGLGSGILIAVIEVLVSFFVLGISIESISVIVMATVMIGFVAGFARPLNMPFNKALPLLFTQYFGQTTLTYTSSVYKVQKGNLKTKKNSKEVKNVQKEDKREIVQYRKTRKKRGRRSPEYLLPRYAKAKYGRGN